MPIILCGTQPKQLEESVKHHLLLEENETHWSQTAPHGRSGCNVLEEKETH